MTALKHKSDEELDDLKTAIRLVLKKLNSASKSIVSSAVMTTDGISIASILGDGVDPDRFGAMCASLLSLAETTAKEINRGHLKQVLVEGTYGSMLVVHVGEDAVLAVAAGKDVNLGMVFMEARKASSYLSKLF